MTGWPAPIEPVEPERTDRESGPGDGCDADRPPRPAARHDVLCERANQIAPESAEGSECSLASSAPPEDGELAPTIGGRSRRVRHGSDCTGWAKGRWSGSSSGSPCDSFTSIRQPGGTSLGARTSRTSCGLCATSAPSPTAPKTLPRISDDDLHLVCWMPSWRSRDAHEGSRHGR